MVTKRAIGHGPPASSGAAAARTVARTTAGGPNRRRRQECHRWPCRPASPATAAASAALLGRGGFPAVSYIFGKEGKKGKAEGRRKDGRTGKAARSRPPTLGVNLSLSLRLSLSRSCTLKEGPKVGGGEERRGPPRHGTLAGAPARARWAHVGKRD